MNLEYFINKNEIEKLYWKSKERLRSFISESKYFIINQYYKDLQSKLIIIS